MVDRFALKVRLARGIVGTPTRHLIRTRVNRATVKAARCHLACFVMRCGYPDLTVVPDGGLSSGTRSLAPQQTTLLLD